MKRICCLLLALLLLTGCGGTKTEAKTLDLEGLYTQMKDSLPEMFELDDAGRLDFLGLKSEDYTEAVTAVCADSMRADEIWLIHAKDGEALKRIEAKAQSRLSVRIEEAKAYSPEQTKILEDAVTMTQGSYFILIVSADAQKLAELIKNAGE